MDPAAIVESLVYRFQRNGIDMEVQNTLSLADCEAQYAEATGKVPANTYNGQVLRPSGGILHYQHVPLLFLHCLRPAEDECIDAAECAMFLRATEMFFAAQPVYPVVFVVEGGSPEFWIYMRIFQMGAEKNRNPYKVAGHSVPIVIQYTTLGDVDVAAEVVRDALEAAAVPDAER
jgi:hypothetical protein